MADNRRSIPTMLRTKGKRFSVDQLRLARQEIAGDLKRQLGTRVAGQTIVSGHHLSPRMAQVLYLLLHGDGEKQVAQTLKIKQNTVHTYVKKLYQTLGVTSRPELLVKCMRSLDSLGPG